MKRRVVLALIAILSTFPACSDDGDPETTNGDASGDASGDSAQSDADADAAVDQPPEDDGSDADGSPAEDADADAAEADGDGGCEGAFTTFSGVLKILGESGGFDDWDPAVGASVCVHGQPEVACATTDAEGSYELACVPAGEAAILFEHDDYASTLWLRVALGATHELDTVLIPDALNTAYFEPAGVTYPAAGLGLITINETGHVDGAVATIEGDEFEGPFYSASGLSLDLEAEGTVGDGLIHFVGPVGTALVRVVDGDGTPCPQATGQWTDDEGRLRIPVLENTESSILVRCP